MTMELLVAPDLAIYVKADSNEQIHKQLDKTLNWARNSGLGWLTVDKIRDAIEEAQHQDRITIQPGEGSSSNDTLHVFVDPIDSDPGLQVLLRSLQPDNGVRGEIIVTDVGSLIDSPNEIGQLVQFLDQHKIAIHAPEQGVSLHSGDNIPRTMLRVLWEASNADELQSCKEDSETEPPGSIREHEAGQPPFGLTSTNGWLVPDPHYEEICNQLRAIKDGDQTKLEAANELGCSRQTVTQALDRPALYSLEVEDD